MVDVNDHRRGILIDLDVAARIRDGDVHLYPVLTYAGTLPFRGIDLLREGTHYPTRAMYRDDLESFFYVLLYIQKYYRNGQRLPAHDTLGWSNLRQLDIQDLASQKRAWLRSATIPDSPLAAEWLVPLHTLFENAYNARGELFRSNLRKSSPKAPNRVNLSDSGSSRETSVSSDSDKESGGGNDGGIDADTVTETGRDVSPIREWGAREEETQDGRLTFKLFMGIIHH